MISKILESALLALTLFHPAWAHDVTENWVSDAGSTIVIPPSHFNVLATPRDGQQFRRRGNCSPEMVGLLFAFTNEYERQLFVTVDRPNSNHVIVNEGHKQWYWNRVNH